jgi:hypothetical protein
MNPPTSYTVTDTPSFIKLAKDSEGRNRGPTPALLDSLDPDGIHLLQVEMVHNDHELRGWWLCKLKDIQKPVPIFMDNSFEAFERLTSSVAAPPVPKPKAKGL